MSSVGPTAEFVNRVTARVGREAVKVTVATDLVLLPAQRVWLRMSPSRIRLMDATTGRALV